ncbi:MAG: ribosomal-processing cysteine protease Prp [Clostridia bacterium]|nr:ribosomal-processing cysteine protease Prp [Clostridia bacterium]
MTKIKIDRYSLIVTARGHAGWDKNGHDIVCAAESMLLYALSDFAQAHGGICIEDDGYMRVEFPPQESEYLYGGFDALCEGLRMLADEYPDHVCVEG